MMIVSERQPFGTIQQAVDAAAAGDVVLVSAGKYREAVGIHGKSGRADAYILIRGQPGAVIGHAAVPDGLSANVSVTIDAAKATPTLYAMLHVDKGAVGT